MSDPFSVAGIQETGTPDAAGGAAPPAGVVLRTEPHACFACGDLNEVGLHLQLHLFPGGCWTELVVPDRFQGWEGVAHGGIVSTILDEVMTWSLIERDRWGVTARLTVAFKRPLMIGRRIRAEGRVVEDRRRLVTTAGSVVDAETGDELASAEGTFVTVTESKKRQLQARYGNLAEARRAAERESAEARGAVADAGAWKRP